MIFEDYDKPLSSEKMTRVMNDIMTLHSSPEEIRMFLTKLAKRGETAKEIAAAASVLRAHALQVKLSCAYELCDTCGTGGDGQGTINISTIAALIAAAAGVRVAKHGNRAASSRCGSADLLEELGVNLDATTEQVARCIEEAGFGFCFAPKFHPAMKIVAPIRKEIKTRTIFNIIGPLANPFPLTFQLLGVSESRLLRPMAQALIELGIRRGAVVHGLDELDELTTTAETQVIEFNQGRLAETLVRPEDFGIRRSMIDELHGGDFRHNAEIARSVLQGKPSAVLDVVCLNAGYAIYICGLATTIHEGIKAAQEAAGSGRALEILAKVKELSHA